MVNKTLRAYANSKWPVIFGKYCIITLNWDSLIAMWNIGFFAGARYAISDCLVFNVFRDTVFPWTGDCAETWNIICDY